MLASRRDWHYEIIARVINDGPISSVEFDSIGCSRETLARVLKNLKRYGAVHICRWERNHVGPPIAWYRAGSGEDAEMPEPLSNRAKQRAARLNKKSMSGDVRIGIWGL